MLDPMQVAVPPVALLPVAVPVRPKLVVQQVEPVVVVEVPLVVQEQRNRQVSQAVSRPYEAHL